mmetsp:Transcript_3539/g.4740  ORF Transcript_3539/g.4740 Transcript_3539/m.4740 type:complete len:225 (+) Transcript_3539:125-799(+)
MIGFCSSLLSVTGYSSCMSENVCPNSQDGYKADRIVHIGWKFPECLPNRYKDLSKWLMKRQKYDAIIEEIVSKERIFQCLQLYSKPQLLASLGYEPGSEEYRKIELCMKSIANEDFVATVHVGLENSKQSWMKIVTLPRETDSGEVSETKPNELSCANCKITSSMTKSFMLRHCDKCKNQFYCHKCWKSHVRFHELSSLSYKTACSPSKRNSFWSYTRSAMGLR